MSRIVAPRGRSVAFVACNRNPGRFGEDPSFVYRCENLAGGLRALGVDVWLGHLTHFPMFRRFDYVVFHRPLAGGRFHLLATWLRARGSLLLADFDDLVFEPGLAEHSPGVVNGLVGLPWTRRRFSRHRRALAGFSAVSLATRPLAEAAAAVVGEAAVHVLPNAVHWRWRGLPEPPWADQVERPVIAYFPGTRSHDRDFSLLAGALSRVLERHPEAALRVAGPLVFDLAARPGQVERLEKLPFPCFHERFRGVSINLAPLESSPFTRCKSAIKVIEGGFWNVPTICSPLPDAERFIGDAALPAENAEAFEYWLEHLLGDPERRARVGAGLRQRVLAQADIHLLAGEWLNWAESRRDA